MTKILCTICARGGSKGVLNKNIRDLCGKPLIAYTIELALKSGLFEHVVISTDSDEIAKISVQYGGEVFFTRAPELSNDEAGKIPVIRDAFTRSEKYFQCDFDILFDLDATSPLRNIDDLKKSLKLFLETNSENLLTGMKAHRNPYFNLVEKNEKGNIVLSKNLSKAIVRRQSAPECFDLNASIYIWSRQSILSDNDSIFFDRTCLYEMPQERSIDIDSELDFFIVKSIMERKC
ncbi:MAG: acylneuraminate cytidylyltransferase family protein [Candidatus Cloacimonetes bacterium]|nr:acylneuraminate cytidylyltransferase family protein [Candidatus Cloacimonadota bacterium]